MSKLNIKRISIHMAKPNMILAEDAVSRTGIPIVIKNTILTDTICQTLEANGVRAIAIFEKIDEKIEAKKDTTNKVKRVSSRINIRYREDNLENDIDLKGKSRVKIDKEYIKKIKREEFSKFKSRYSERIQVIENQFASIGDGFGIEIESVYRGITDIVKSVNCKSDIFGFLSKLQKKDDRVYEHCLNVSLVANLFAIWLGYNDDEIKDITLAGLLHDIGKMKIRDSIIKKDSKLTDEEYSDMKKHSYIGYKLIKDFNLPEEVKLAVLMHHEKMDGSGYPFGKKDKEICQTAKIIAICDIYEAMTADNYYRKKYCPFEVISSLEKDYYGLLDTKLLLAFLQNIAYTYIGSKVVLSNDIEARIVFINQNCFSRPMVRVGDEFIDLYKEDIYIKEVL